MQLRDKVAIITGAARGIGREIAFRFIREGAKVILCDVHDCYQVAQELAATGGAALPLKTDITSETDTLEMAKRAAEYFGRIDVLVNNAARYGAIEHKNFRKPFEEITVDEWDSLMEVNLKGMFLCCKAVVPYMKQQESGKIVNIASSVAYSGAPIFLHYTTSKGGVVSMTRALARALGEFNINVNAIAPGFTNTEASQSLAGADYLQHYANTYFILKRLTTPAHIAAAVCFLASSDADQITGQILGVNAGEVLQ